MKKINLTIKARITLWFAVLILLLTGLIFAVLYSVSATVLKNDVRALLTQTVADNAEEIEFFNTAYQGSTRDQYLKYGDGYLVIDDDFCDYIGGVYTALYDAEGNLLYGENPLAGYTRFPVNYQSVRTVSAGGEGFYVYDMKLKGTSLDGMWLRGIAAEGSGSSLLGTLVRWSLLLLPVFAVVIILSGYLVVRGCLRPVGSMSRTAGEITGGADLSRRIELHNSRDELYGLADSFNGMLDRLQTSFEHERRFTSDVSHELRTPTSVILARCEYSLENDITADDFRESLTVIDRQGKRLSGLINQLLSFLRLGQSNGIRREKLDFSRLAADVCCDTLLPEDTGITLATGIEPGIILNGDGVLLSRMLDNLISNAVKYGRPNGHVTVGLAREGTVALLSVTDDGIGIPREHTERIFERFYRVDNARSGNGSFGLGLAMVREIAGLHGGAVSVESTPGVGSRFTVRLPLASTE